MADLDKEFDSKRIEARIREWRRGLDMEGLIRGSGKPGRARFVEGPPTMNGVPHVGHLRGRVIKDMWYRYRTLRGDRVAFNAGWDTQGLPVELQAEKELGVTGGKSEVLERIGAEKLVSKCKELVLRYSEAWARVDDLLGVSLNREGAYWTYRDGFIEREWQILKSGLENGILEEDHTVIAYCPSCQTSLSHAEVNQGYEEVTDPSLYYKVRLADEDAFLIVWTTMPFTLVTDAMVGLNPDEEYHYVGVRGGETWIVGKTRLEGFLKEVGIDEYAVRRTVKGSEFEGKKYVHPLLDGIPALAECAKSGNYHTAVSEGFVDSGAGSGLVHLSPANGEEDIAIAQRRGVEIFNPIDDEVRFTADAGRYRGLFVRDADRMIVDDLRDRGALVRIGRIRHKYPLCWRSRHPVVWMARRGWFYKLDRLHDKAVRAAEGVEYFYEAPKNRFLGIVRERHPWCISRERIWGCPLPVWICGDCGAHTWCFSRREIIENAGALPDGEDFELHVPWIDRVTVRCRGCGGTNTVRDRYVLDTWHNSGSAPYSSLTDTEYKDEIPAPFFTEGIDQTRGWAYTLLIENVILNNAPASPYGSFLFQGHVLDEKGNKMSKSRGNVTDGEELLARYPADLVRFYFVWKSSPIEPLNFDTQELMSRPYQILSTLYHLHLYYAQNSEYDGFDASVQTVGWAGDGGLLGPADVWLLSKLQRLVGSMTELNDGCRYHESARSFEDFVINSLSQTYIPITRGQLWDEDDSKRGRRLAIYAILRHVLSTLDILIHPLCPYTSEYLHLGAFGKDTPLLLEDWPVPQESLVDDSVEGSFDLMTGCVSVSAAARMRARLKRRWPLGEAVICLGRGQKGSLEPLSGFLVSQLNVERCTIHELDDHGGGLGQFLEMAGMGLPVRPVVDLEAKRVGPRAGRLMGALVKKHAETDPADIARSLGEGSGYAFALGGGDKDGGGGGSGSGNSTDIVLGPDDFTVSFEAADGFALSRRDGITVILPAKRDPEMVAKGLIKDIARRIQTLRKERGYNPTDVLEAAAVLDLDAEMQSTVQAMSRDLAFLVRVKRIEFSDVCTEYREDTIDGRRIRIGIK